MPLPRRLISAIKQIAPARPRPGIRARFSPQFNAALLAGLAALSAPAPVTAETLLVAKSTRAVPVARDNAGIAADILDLSFELETGRRLPRFTRFEGPVRVALRGTAPRTLIADLDSLVGRLRREARIDIRRAKSAARSNIVIETVPRRSFASAVKGAACFVVPNVASWGEYMQTRGTARTDWTRLTTRTRAAIFMPNDASPQALRDCLHEELAQALGPLNDLYRLHDSVFNDDNFHNVLTAFDMLVLRATYAPELKSGMNRDQVAAILPGLLARLNPAGGQATTLTTRASSKRWQGALSTALGPDTGSSARLRAAEKAVKMAKRQNLSQMELAFSYFALGRTAVGRDDRKALAAFRAAHAIFHKLPGTSAHQAQVDLQLTAYALRGRDGRTALALVNRALPHAAKAQDADVHATLLMMKAEALRLLGQTRAAEQVHLDSLDRARYGIGDARAIQARLNEVRALTSGRG